MRPYVPGVQRVTVAAMVIGGGLLLVGVIVLVALVVRAIVNKD